MEQSAPLLQYVRLLLSGAKLRAGAGTSVNRYVHIEIAGDFVYNTVEKCSATIVRDFGEGESEKFRA